MADYAIGLSFHKAHRTVVRAVALNSPCRYFATRDAAGIITYLLLIAFIVIPFAIIGRLKQNIFPVIVLFSVLVFSMIFVPWEFFGAPTSGGLLSHLHLLS